MAFFMQPLFNWPPRRHWQGGHIQDVVLTAAGAEHFNQLYSATCLSMGTKVGAVYQANGAVEVYHNSGHHLGTTENKINGAEELVRMYVRQNAD